MNYKILHGDVIAMLKTLPDNSADAVVNDPPYGIDFMGKNWDSFGREREYEERTGYQDKGVLPGYGRGGTSEQREAYRRKSGLAFQEFCYNWAVEALRVLKPGGHLLSFGGSRTYHRMACAVEDAGFEIRDQIQWIYGCLDEQTQLVSKNGIKPYHKSIIGERVLCYSPESGEYSYQPILEIVEYDYSDTAYRLIGDFGEQIVSRNHRCIVERCGDETFELAEKIARERETRVPILENLSALREAFYDGQSHSGVTKQSLQPDMLQRTDRGEEQWRETSIAKNDDGNNLSLRKQKMGGKFLAETSENSNLQSQMQRDAPGRRLEASRAQGTPALDGGIESHGEDSNDGGNKPGVEGWVDLSKTQRGIRRPVNKICSLPNGVSGDGPERRLRDGTSPIGRTNDWQSVAEGRSSTSPESSSDGEPNLESNVVCDECSTQGIRAWRGHKTAVVRVVPFHYTGKMWCLRVPTGAFVAVRGGVAFPTGNSGFPKSLDVSKAIDKSAGAEREVIGVSTNGSGPNLIKLANHDKRDTGIGIMDGSGKVFDITAPATDDAKKWQGWATALKPAHEPIVLARKPLIGTVADNVLTHGTGALNIAACRIPGEPVPINKLEAWSGFGQEVRPEYKATMSDVGRWPSNLIHDGSEEVLEEFAKYGDKSSARANGNPNEPKRGGNSTPLWGFSDGRETHDFRDSGTAARFFYCAKASREDRNEGCEEFEKKPLNWSSGTQSPGTFQAEGTDRSSRNNHPTVKPTDLMRYLCKMITPPGGTVLDCFMGSGSTGKAALMEGFNFIGIDKDENYCAISKARMEHVLATDMPLLRAIEVAEREAEIEPQITQEMFNF